MLKCTDSLLPSEEDKTFQAFSLLRCSCQTSSCHSIRIFIYDSQKKGLYHFLKLAQGSGANQMKIFPLDFAISRPKFENLTTALIYLLRRRRYISFPYGDLNFFLVSLMHEICTLHMRPDLFRVVPRYKFHGFFCRNLWQLHTGGRNVWGENFRDWSLG